MQKELIYEMMNGEVDLNQLSLSRNISIEDEFSNGRKCGELYDRVYNAKLRLEEKLGAEEDADVEEMISCMNDISKILAFKMYEYGLQFSLRS